MEYDMLKRNAELLACWCKIGNDSGVRRFRSEETAYSPQTAPGRFVRLGLAGVVVGGAAAYAFAAAGAATGAGAAAASATTAEVAGAAATTEVAATTVGVAAAAQTTASYGSSISAGLASAGGKVLQVGRLAASTAAQSLLMDMVSRPEHARNVFQEVNPMPNLIPGNAGSSSSGQVAAGVALGTAAVGTSMSSSSSSLDRSYRDEQQSALVSAVQSYLNSLGVRVPKPVAPLVDCPLGCSRLCEMLVDLLEAAEPESTSQCTVIVQSFLDELHA